MARLKIELKQVNVEQLAEELNILPFCDGTASDETGTHYTIFRREPVDETELESWITQVRAVEAAHNPSVKTQEQLDREQADTDKTDFRAAIANRITDIDTDLAALPAAQLAEVKQIIARMLRAEKRQLKYIRHQ